jgi:predicted kinase
MSKLNNRLYIICGLSFAGKSTLAREIAERFGYEEVDVDRMKYSLYGSDAKDESLTREEWDRLYEETDKQIVLLLKSGKNVVDASRNFSGEERRRIRTTLNQLGYETLTIYLDTPEAIARQRWQANRKNPTRRDVSESDFEDVIRAMEPPTIDENPIVLHYGEDFESWIAKNVGLFT